MGTNLGYRIDDDGTFHAPLDLTYPYKRTVGDTMSRFLTSLRDGRLEGTVGADGRVYVPPAEFDPVTGEPLTEWREVSGRGTIVTWSWQPEVFDGLPLQRPFAWALVRLDGSDVPMLHVVDVASPDEVSTGMRVAVRWADERSGTINDIAAFVPESQGQTSAVDAGVAA